MELVDRAPTILIVDDVAMFRDLGRVFLARSGRVVTATHADEALALARRERPALILTDLHMPGMDGAELCRAVKSEPLLCHTSVVIVAGDGNAEDHARAVRAGADDVLTKPLARMALIASVNRFLRFAAVRGLPRVDVEVPVRIRVDREETLGTIRNVSRGGAFIEPARPLGLEPRMELSLSFRLTEAGRTLVPQAQLVWERSTENDGPAGVGVRFLGLDRPSTSCIEEFVMDHAILYTRVEEGAAAVNS
jgi:CheY-like chemotaxis protein